MKTLSALVVFAIFAFITPDSRAANPVNIIQAPAGSLVPDVVMDQNGILHMVYAKDQNAYYIRSTDQGATFSLPVKVNSSGTVEYNMGERGPKLSVGSDGTIHVAWMDHWSAGVNVHARYARSQDGGNTFEPPRSLSANPGVDGVTVAADGSNHVVVFWHIMVPVQTQVPQATWLHTARSADNGDSFTSDENVLISNHSGLACSMCMTRARFGSDDKVYLAFRSGENSIRDFYVLKGNPFENNFTSVRVNNDNWNINYCPMVGPELEIGDDGKQYCAFMSDYHVYWAVSDPAVSSFTKHIATPLNETDELFPTAIANNAGTVLFVWQVGPMSVSDSATVKWALYNADGSFTGQQSTVGRTFSGTKATTFTGSDDNFYIVVNTDFPVLVLPVRDHPAISCFPNPASDFITIPGNIGKAIIRFYDQSGKMMMEKIALLGKPVDVSQLKQGTYALEVFTDRAGNFSTVLVKK